MKAGDRRVRAFLRNRSAIVGLALIALVAIAAIFAGPLSPFDPETRVQTYQLEIGRRSLRLSGFHLLFGLVLLAVLPQLVYLLSRNLSLQFTPGNAGFRWHWDEFFAGSGGGNCGLPGNEACRWNEPVNRLFQPVLAALFWGGALFLLLYVNRAERRAQRLYFLGAWLCTALSALAKGAPGLVLPLVITLVSLAAARRYKDYARLELVGFGLQLRAQRRASLKRRAW